MGTIKNREKKIKISVGAILNLYHGQKNLIGVGVGRRVVRRLGGATYRMRLRILGSRMSRSFFNSMGLHTLTSMARQWCEGYKRRWGSHIVDCLDLGTKKWCVSGGRVKQEIAQAMCFQTCNCV